MREMCKPARRLAGSVVVRAGIIIITIIPGRLFYWRSSCSGVYTRSDNNIMRTRFAAGFCARKQPECTFVYYKHTGNKIYIFKNNPARGRTSNFPRQIRIRPSRTLDRRGGGGGQQNVIGSLDTPGRRLRAATAAAKGVAHTPHKKGTRIRVKGGYP